MGASVVSVVRNLPANAGDTGSVPDLDLEQLRLCSTTTEPVPQSPGIATTESICCKHCSQPTRQEPVLSSQRGHHSEKQLRSSAANK